MVGVLGWGVTLGHGSAGLELDHAGREDDTLTGHLQPGVAGAVLAGHEKPLPATWIAALLTPLKSRPDPAKLPWRGTQLGTPTGDHEFQEQVAWVRAALRCHDILKLRNAASARLTPGRLVYNILRSPENTRLRIRPDPEQAYRRFCGPGTSPEVGALRSGSG
jgi:hypothetical protein